MGNHHSTKSSGDEKGSKKKNDGQNQSKQIQTEIEKDLNNNLREVTPVTPVVLPNAKSSHKSIVALHYIKSKISRFFNFRTQTVGKAVMTEDINANFPGSPLIRKVPSAKNASALWKESRPFTPQMPNFQRADVILVTDQSNGVKSATAPPLKRSSNETTSSASGTNNSSPTRNNNSHSKEFNSAKRSFGNPRSNRTISNPNNPIENSKGVGRSCICRPVAPPVYLDYGAASRSGGNTQNAGNGSGERNPIMDRLQAVDVIEELQYHVPGGDCGNSDDEFEYFYCCDGCGEMERCENPKLKDGGGKPVTYSRRQRFNFNNSNSDNSSGQPNAQWCPCTCCSAGLRRNPNCECQCCGQKGKSRVSNPFDEIPVGKNPELKPWTCSEEEDEENSDKILPCGSGVYFYDARKCKFIRQIPRTQTPVVLENEFESTGSSSLPTSTADTEPCPDITEVLGSLPPKRPPASKRERSDPEPVILPPIYGGLSFDGDDNEQQHKTAKHENNSSAHNETSDKSTATEQRKSENGSDASSYSISSYSTSSSSSSGTHAKEVSSKEIKTQK